MSLDQEEPSLLEQEMRIIALRLREKYDLDVVVVLSSKQEIISDGSEGTTSCYGMSGNHFAARHLARRYAEQ